jgi:hypothetical protein
MTKLKTIITAILIGTSSMATVAAAHPANGYWSGARDHRTPQNNGYAYGYGYGRDIDPGYTYRRDDNDDDDYGNGDGYGYGYGDRPVEGPRWAAMSDSVSASGDRQFIHMNGARASTIRFDLQYGRVYIYEIAVEFMNGRTQVQQVQRWMQAGRDNTEILDLGGSHAIKRVMVYTADGERASYQILGA